ncbi:MAG: insulinase family protein [Planctomycetia bacterium]|nr:insulinase family protein [Planctomycetia bacterium]
MEFRESVLANGLEVVAECNPQAHSTALGFFVKTGARDEQPDLAGVSHFLEHMVFKGTARRTADDVNREFDEMGAHYNAFTSEEKTVYYAAVLPEYQDRALELLADIMRPALREQDFNTERQVILEEIQMYQDQPPFGADDRCKAAHFAGHPLGHSVLGTLESVGRLPVAAMREYFERRYSPANIALVAAGRVDFDALVLLAQQHCGDWRRLEAPRRVDPAPLHTGFECMRKEGVTQQYGLQIASGPSATDADRFAAKLLATVVGDDSGSRLFWSLVDPGLAEHASLGHYDYLGTGMYLTYLSCAPDQAASNLQRILDVYREVEARGVSEQELAQAKNKINSRVVLSSERPRGRLFNLGANWTNRREYRSIKDDLDAVDAVTVAQIAAVLAKYPLSQATTVTIGSAESVPAPT